jgi:hypothetical protein
MSTTQKLGAWIAITVLTVVFAPQVWAADAGPASSAAAASSAKTAVSASSSAIPAAVQKALELPEGGERTKAMIAAAVEWQKKDPQAALAWAVGLPKGQSNYQTLNRVAQAWGNRDPKAALEGAMSLEPKGGNLAMSALHLIVTAWARADPQAALAWAEKQTRADLHRTAYFSVADGWAQKDPPPAADWAAKLADDNDRHLTVGEVAHGWVWTPSFVKNPEAAMAWVEELQAGELKMAAGSIAEGVARKDAPKAKAWVEGLPLTDAEKAEIIQKFPTPKK